VSLNQPKPLVVESYNVAVTTIIFMEAI